MGMTRVQKEAEVTALNERFANDELVVVAQYSGLTVHELEDFRGQISAPKAQPLKSPKTRWPKMAVKGTKFENISRYVHRPRRRLPHRKTPSLARV